VSCIVSRLRTGRAVFSAALLSLLFLLAMPSLAAVQQTFSGTLQVTVEDHADQHSRTRYFLLERGRRSELRDVRAAPGLVSGTPVRVRGIQTGNWLALDLSGGTNVVATSPAVLNYTMGVQNVAVIMVNFADDTSQPLTASAMQSAVFSDADAFFRETSGGQTWLAGSVFGWFTLPLSKTGCDSDQIRSLADQAATAAGANLSSYSRKFYVFPKNACTWAGAAMVGGANTWALFNGIFDVDNFGHEFGHNLGLDHSHGLDCDTGPLGAICSTLDYGDGSDVMGNIPGHYNGFQKERLGWLTGMSNISTSGRYTLTPYENGTGSRVLKLAGPPDSGGQPTWYYLEYRQPIGFDAVLANYGNLTKGVQVRRVTTAVDAGSYLLDMTPNTNPASGFSDLRDGMLAAGRSFNDPAVNLTVTVVSGDSSGAVVDVTVGPQACQTAAPALSISGGVAAPAGSTSNYTVSIVNRDGSGCAASTFNLSSVLPSGWVGQFSSPSLSLSAGASGTATFALTSAGSAPAATYAFTLNASCTRGSACAGSVTGSASVLASQLIGSVASSKAVYSKGEIVGMGAQLLNNGAAVKGATVAFTITRPNGSTVSVNATTDSAGSASAVYRMNNKKDGPGAYVLRAQATWGGQSMTATTTYSVQ
jgi:hypothetical protein